MMVGTRKVSNLDDWLRVAGDKASIGSIEDAAIFGGLMVLAVKGSAPEFVLDLVGAANLHEKTIINTCNPTREDQPENGVLRFFTPQHCSLMEKPQSKYSRLHFVTAFT